MRVYTIRRMPTFDAWLAAIRDGHTRLRLLPRLEKAQAGNFGVVEPVGSGVSEMREHFGAGWCMYYVQPGRIVIVMLGDGTKRTQKADIAAAKRLAANLED